MHRLHFSSGSSDVSLPNPMQLPSLSLPALPIFRCMLHVWIRFLILHFLQITFSPTVQPFFSCEICRPYFAGSRVAGSPAYDPRATYIAVNVCFYRSFDCHFCALRLIFISFVPVCICRVPHVFPISVVSTDRTPSEAAFLCSCHYLPAFLFSILSNCCMIFSYLLLLFFCAWYSFAKLCVSSPFIAASAI